MHSADEARLANLLGALGVALHDDLGETVAAAGELPISDAAALNVIANSPGCSVKHLGLTLDLTHAGAVRVVDRLEAAGLAARGEGPDHRTRGLDLTNDGRRRWMRQTVARGERLGQLVAGLRPQQRAALATAVEPLLAALTHDQQQGERICRLCDESACPQASCPVTTAAPA